jgi:hypothetical protein
VQAMPNNPSQIIAAGANAGGAFACITFENSAIPLIDGSIYF